MPTHTASYSLRTARSLNAASSSSSARAFSAKTRSPAVFLSNLCTGRAPQVRERCAASASVFTPETLSATSTSASRQTSL